MTAKRQISNNPEQREPTPSLKEKRLRVGAKIRATKLWEEFTVQRKFEAFSIHTLASTIEPLFEAERLLSSFEVTECYQTGNKTFLRGVFTIEDVDSDEQKSWLCVGEGNDNGDKGTGKALSYARKAGYIQAFQLSVGTDNEAEHTPSTPPGGGQYQPYQSAQPNAPYYRPQQNQPQMQYGGYQPPQSAAYTPPPQPQTQSYNAPPPPQQAPTPPPPGTPSYRLSDAGGAMQEVFAPDIINWCTQQLSRFTEYSDVDVWLGENSLVLQAVWQADKHTGFAISEAAGVRKDILSKKAA